MQTTDFDFIDEFTTTVDELDLDWDIYGLIDQNENIYSLTDDAKIVGRVFELVSAPAIREVASTYDFDLTPAESQTIYPDFTLEKDVEYIDEADGLKKGDELVRLDGENVTDRQSIEDILSGKKGDELLSCKIIRNGNEISINIRPPELQKIAVDVKTTYREFYSRKYTYSNGDTYEAGEPQPHKFTLGSFASFLRNHTKNIQYDYRSYADHYVVGFIYARNPDSEEGIVKSYQNRDKILSPYENIEYFVQHKYKIAGVTPGSGNTENIGSFRTNSIEDLREGKGPFAEHGKEIYKEYWRNYPRYKSGEDTFSDLEEFFEWKESN